MRIEYTKPDNLQPGEVAEYLSGAEVWVVYGGKKPDARGNPVKRCVDCGGLFAKGDLHRRRGVGLVCPACLEHEKSL